MRRVFSSNLSIIPYYHSMYKLSDYQYELGSGYIAQTPAVPADSSKLLVPSWNSIYDYHFRDLPKLLTKKDVLFFNDTKVVRARVLLEDVFVEIPHHQSASRTVDTWEVFFLRLVDSHRFEWLVTLTKRIRKGAIIHFSKAVKLTVEELTEKWVIFRIDGVNPLTFFDRYGHLPLPPYISHTPEKEECYQTIFAQHIGSVAAPTASLHFTDEVINELESKKIRSHYLTLHVGLGTFKPVDTEDIRDYKIHEETMVLDEAIFETIAFEKKQKKNIIATWTTVARTIETLAYLRKIMGKSGNDYRDTLTKDITMDQCKISILSWKQEWKKIVCETKIFIYPWFERKVVDGLITNFHLPWSTLLMLVASFIGYDHMVKIYKHAIKNLYRFFSFGDAMFLRKM